MKTKDGGWLVASRFASRILAQGTSEASDLLMGKTSRSLRLEDTSSNL